MARETPPTDEGRNGGDDPPPNAAQGAQTIADVIRALEADGYAGQFRAVEGGNVECFTCREISPAATVAVAKMERLEGPTDPADMLAVAAISCPQCSARGTLLLGYGPDSTLEDAEALEALGNARPD
jgi:hypothetical protein